MGHRFVLPYGPHGMGEPAPKSELLAPPCHRRTLDFMQCLLVNQHNTHLHDQGLTLDLVVPRRVMTLRWPRDLRPTFGS